MEPLAGRSRHRGLALLAILIALAGPAVAEESLEYKVKAVFLLNFTKFVNWPANTFQQPDSPFTICLLGDDPFGSALDQIVKGEVVNDRRVAVQRLNRAPLPKACQVLFLGVPRKEVAAVLPQLGQGILTVADGEDFVRDGGMIAFVLENRRVRFVINQRVAESSGLKLSSRLLGVARPMEK